MNHKPNSIFEAASEILFPTDHSIDEARGKQYVLMNSFEKALKDMVGDIYNFRHGHEELALEEIEGALLHCQDLVKKIKSELNANS